MRPNRYRCIRCSEPKRGSSRYVRVPAGRTYPWDTAVPDERPQRKASRRPRRIEAYRLRAVPPLRRSGSRACRLPAPCRYKTMASTANRPTCRSKGHQSRGSAPRCDGRPSGRSGSRTPQPGRSGYRNVRSRPRSPSNRAGRAMICANRRTCRPLHRDSGSARYAAK